MTETLRKPDSVYTKERKKKTVAPWERECENRTLARERKKQTKLLKTEAPRPLDWEAATSYNVCFMSNDPSSVRPTKVLRGVPFLYEKAQTRGRQQPGNPTTCYREPGKNQIEDVRAERSKDAGDWESTSERQYPWEPD